MHKVPHAAAAVHSAQRRWLLMAAVSVVLRPPTALFWLLTALWRLSQQQRSRERAALVLDAVCIGGLVLGCMVLIDRVGYGR